MNEAQAIHSRRVHQARLDEWFFLSSPALTLKEAQEELRKDGCHTSLDSLSRWRQRRETERDQELVQDWSEDMEEECRKFMPDASAPISAVSS
jgi:hypothetical protein